MDVLSGGIPIVYRTVIRPALFRLPPENAQRLAESALRIGPLWRFARPALAGFDARLRTEFAGLVVPSPIGAAAGLDKDCKFLGSLLDLGFGFATGGTVTLGPRPGNPRPRLARQTRSEALVNAMGFPGAGLESASERLSKLTGRAGRLFVSISGTIEDEIIQCHRRLEPLCSLVEINISSPNTGGLRAFHEPGRLRALTQSLASGKRRPLFVKLPPWERDRESRAIGLSLAETAVDAGADGVIVANTRPVEYVGMALGRGGMSGLPLYDDTLRMVAETRAALGKRGAIVACGGVFTASQLWRLLAVGASAAQLYTALVYRGPGLPGSINRGLVRLMEKADCKSIVDIEGAPPS